MAKKKAISLAMALPPVGLVVDQVQRKGITYEAAGGILAGMTGYDPTQQTFNKDWAIPFWMGEVAGIVVHKVATKVGLNKSIKAMTGGWLQI